MKAIRDTLELRLQLAERIAGLPHIHTVEDTSRTLPWSVDVFVQPPIVSLRKQRHSFLLCTLSHDSVRVYGPGKQESTVLSMPVDPDELEACWEAIRVAHDRLLSASAATRPVRTAAWPGRLPSFSRTTLQ